jgi:hypothetical protein
MNGKLKLSALKGGAFRHGGFLYIIPLHPAMKGGDYGVLSVQFLAYGHYNIS